jgi:hypothetical protein
MKSFRKFLPLLMILCSSCAGFQNRIDLPVPSSEPTKTAIPIQITQTPIPNIHSLPQPTLFQTVWNNPDRYNDSASPSQRDLLPGWFPRPEYMIEVTISEDLKQIEGKTEILVVNSSNVDLKDLALHFYPILFGADAEIKDIKVNGTQTRSEYPITQGIIMVPLDKPLFPGEAAVLSLSFSYSMPIDSSSNYMIFGNSPGQVTLAHFYPMLAALDDGGWHTENPPKYGDVTYTEAAFYQVRVHAPSDVVIVASGNETNTENTPTTQTREYVIGPAHDFFLAAAKDYKTFTTQADDIRVRCFALASGQDGCRQASNIAKNALQFFNEVIGPYPYSDFVIMATHTDALGVEYPGVIAINQNLSNMESGSTDTQQNKYLNSTVVHEVGHQWFYNLIGNDQVNEPWIDESTTQFITYLYFRVEAGQSAGIELLNSFQTRSDRVNDPTIPIGKPVAAYTPEEYGAVIYGKGPLLLHDIEDQIGSEAMLNFLSAMYQHYQWQNIDTQEMEQGLEASCSCDLQPLFSEWIGPTTK